MQLTMIKSPLLALAAAVRAIKQNAHQPILNRRDQRRVERAMNGLRRPL
ncbi:MAG: hypothetical protein AAB289_10955 [Chloroflexota bacterium]